MLITELVDAAKLTSSALEDLEDDAIVNLLRHSLRMLSARSGIKFTVTGATWDTYSIDSPTVTDSLAAVITLQAKQIINGSNSTIKTKVGSISVEYNPVAWERDELFLEKLLEGYAAEAGISLTTGYAVIGFNEYDLTLNPWIDINTIDRAIYGSS